MTYMRTLKTTLLTAFVVLPCTTYSNWPTSILKGIKDTLLSPLRSSNTKKKSSSSKSIARTTKPSAPKKQAAPAAPSQADYTLTESQAHEYIDNLIASYDLALRPHVKDNQLEVVKNLLKEIIYQPYAWTETSAGKRYKKEIIDEYVNAVVAQHIVQRSYEYALKHTKNETLSMDIAGTVFNMLLELIEKKGALDMEELVNFLGKPLKKAIKERAKQLKQQHHTTPGNAAPKPSQQQNGPAQLYPSEECCACLESFEKVTPVFLSPCGHDMCAECACEWFFGENSKTSCPKCRSTVNLSQLAQAIQAS